MNAKFRHNITEQRHRWRRLQGTCTANAGVVCWLWLYNVTRQRTACGQTDFSCRQRNRSSTCSKLRLVLATSCKVIRICWSTKSIVIKLRHAATIGRTATEEKTQIVTWVYSVDNVINSATNLNQTKKRLRDNIILMLNTRIQLYTDAKPLTTRGFLAGAELINYSILFKNLCTWENKHLNRIYAYVHNFVTYSVKNRHENDDIRLSGSIFDNIHYVARSFSYPSMILILLRRPQNHWINTGYMLNSSNLSSYLLCSTLCMMSFQNK